MRTANLEEVPVFDDILKKTRDEIVEFGQVQAIKVTSFEAFIVIAAHILLIIGSISEMIHG